jgi:polysaccharide biosynthesis/export protein
MIKTSFNTCFIITLLLTGMVSAQGQQSGAAAGSTQVSCNQIALFGALKMPGRLATQSGHRLLEVLALGGGPTRFAGKTVRVVHSCRCSPCSESEKAHDQDEYNLAEVLRGVAAANINVVPGDIVIIPFGDSVIVVGNVSKPGGLPLSERMTVSRAIALVGGISRSSDMVTVRITRISPAGQRQDPIIVNLKSVLERRTEDILLRPLDVVEVSDEQGHFLLPGLSPPVGDPPLLPRRDNSGS